MSTYFMAVEYNTDNWEVIQVLGTYKNVRDASYKVDEFNHRINAFSNVIAIVKIVEL